MNADIINNILSIALQAAVEEKQLEIERTRMQLADQQSKVNEKTGELMEEVSYIHSQLYSIRNANEINRSLYEASCDAINILDPAHPEDYD